MTRIDRPKFGPTLTSLWDDRIDVLFSRYRPNCQLWGGGIDCTM